jgi:hypothetical protein
MAVRWRSTEKREGRVGDDIDSALERFDDGNGRDGSCFTPSG